MLKLNIFFAVLIVLALGFTSGHAREKQYTVKNVIDGNTIELDSGETVRYIGVDPPSLGRRDEGPEFYAGQAARYNKKLVFMKNVRLEFDEEKKDDKGNLLAYVFIKNTFVNENLIRNGYARAHVTEPNTRYREALLSAEKEAMSNDRGVWQEAKKDTESIYIGNKRVRNFHRPTCKTAESVSEKNKMIFRNRSDAIKIGYIPCRTCKP